MMSSEYVVNVFIVILGCMAGSVIVIPRVQGWFSNIQILE